MKSERLEDLAQECLAVCNEKGWSRHWEAVSCHLHLESSEFIEAVRGKRGDPVEEAGDVLFVLFSGMKANGISVEDALRALEAKLPVVRARDVADQHPARDA